MTPRTYRRIVLICLIALGLVFCNLPAELQVTTTQPGANETALMQTAAAGAAEAFTQIARYGQPGMTPPPPATETPTLTSSPSPSPTFLAHNPSGDKFEFTLKLCSKNGLAGSCLTQTLTYIS